DVDREFVDSADHLEPDVVLGKRLQLAAQVSLEQRHQRGDLGGGTLPVFDGERVQRQYLDAQPGTGFDDLTHGARARPVTFHPRQVTLTGPATVAVHDDGDVCRQAVRLNSAGQVGVA